MGSVGCYFLKQNILNDSSSTLYVFSDQTSLSRNPSTAIGPRQWRIRELKDGGGGGALIFFGNLYSLGPTADKALLYISSGVVGKMLKSKASNDAFWSIYCPKSVFWDLERGGGGQWPLSHDVVFKTWAEKG